MARKRMKGCKYRRVSQQQKYIFLKLCVTEQQSIHEAAYNAGIHYSTAKTILFFHKKNYKNYSSYYVQDPQEISQKSDAKQASWKVITIDLDGHSTEKQSIQIIVDSKSKMKKSCKQKYNSNRRKQMVFSDDDENTIKVQAESEEIMRVNPSMSSSQFLKFAHMHKSQEQKQMSGIEKENIALAKEEQSQNEK